jgi:hypothetical protein
MALRCRVEMLGDVRLFWEDRVVELGLDCLQA